MDKYYGIGVYGPTNLDNVSICIAALRYELADPSQMVESKQKYYDIVHLEQLRNRDAATVVNTVIRWANHRQLAGDNHVLLDCGFASLLMRDQLMESGVTPVLIQRGEKKRNHFGWCVTLGEMISALMIAFGTGRIAIARVQKDGVDMSKAFGDDLTRFKAQALAKGASWSELGELTDNGMVIAAAQSIWFLNSFAPKIVGDYHEQLYDVLHYGLVNQDR